MKTNHKETLRLAVKLAKETHYRHAVLAMRWPQVGWVYYVAPVGSVRERSLRQWRRELERGVRRG
jgi:hypothetical protein